MRFGTWTFQFTQIDTLKRGVTIWLKFTGKAHDLQAKVWCTIIIVQYILFTSTTVHKDVRNLTMCEVHYTAL